MDGKYNFIGIVEKSETKKRGCGGLITILTVVPEKELESYKTSADEKPEVSIPGRHNVRVGDRIGVNYSSNCEGY